ncbi:hypothetical protein [Stutzerimonas frequens]|uniref:hypothetical protein n=1 Tax=Stutzerimonas frequens TaxID=2968969 RepID=UPI00190BADBF|nr:hypothetical protein [Stutzerimonas frequens]MCD1640208.1 hypothetical protein [Stutzerimonas stutzeri]MBK3759015.1 hypothetical protein [Stutzerimonas frequens]MBK3873261.1 hypothetical protein [Stutzerimonas frequens]MBK3911530.1 hypothetical protein [Stutzerimonas frequens]MBK3930813.1 hypothetical protein [Stutzerimonas frequens]
MHQRYQWLAEQLDGLQACRQGERADHADLQRFVLHRVDHLLAGHFLQGKVHRREGLAEGQNRPRQNRGKGRRRGEAHL